MVELDGVGRMSAGKVVRVGLHITSQGILKATLRGKLKEIHGKCAGELQLLATLLQQPLLLPQLSLRGQLFLEVG